MPGYLCLFQNEDGRCCYPYFRLCANSHRTRVKLLLINKMILSKPMLRGGLVEMSTRRPAINLDCLVFVF